MLMQLEVERIDIGEPESPGAFLVLMFLIVSFFHFGITTVDAIHMKPKF